MNKPIRYKTRGHRADIGSFEIHRLVSNNYASHVGHFVFLDHIAPFMLAEKHLNKDAAHPHRGIATLTYLLHGEAEHFDSRGHKGTVHSGGVQWMKAGNGIVHNEAVGPDSNTGGKLVHGFQFWMNLPAIEKQKDPEYMALQSHDLPTIQLPQDAGTLKVVVGTYNDQSSKIPTYAEQFLYHIRLSAGSQFVLPTKSGLDYAVFLPQNDLQINNEHFHLGELIGFADEEGNITFNNDSAISVEFILFGGEKYTEPVAAYGPFVMNSMEEIQVAHQDYMRGQYGNVVYR